MDSNDFMISQNDFPAKAEITIHSAYLSFD